MFKRILDSLQNCFLGPLDFDLDDHESIYVFEAKRLTESKLVDDASKEESVNKPLELTECSDSVNYPSQSTKSDNLKDSKLEDIEEEGQGIKYNQEITAQQEYFRTMNEVLSKKQHIVDEQEQLINNLKNILEKSKEENSVLRSSLNTFCSELNEENSKLKKEIDCNEDNIFKSHQFYAALIMEFVSNKERELSNKDELINRLKDDKKRLIENNSSLLTRYNRCLGIRIQKKMKLNSRDTRSIKRNVTY